MRERARAALAELPHALIDTLHGLAGRVVRASALDLGLAPTYRVLEEDAARASVDAVTEEVLSSALVRGDRAAMDLLDAGSGLALTRRRVADFSIGPTRKGSASTSSGAPISRRPRIR